MSDGYFSSPAVAGSKVAFVSEDDLWLYDLDTKTPAIRLTTSDGQIRNPVFNPDGTIIAYSSNEFGAHEIYTFNLETGTHTRLTYYGKLSLVRFWDAETNKIIFSSDYGRPIRGTYLYAINPRGGEPEQLPYGHTITYGRSGSHIVLGRYQDDNARWKRYRGGTAGQIWYSATGDDFVKLDLPAGNHVAPMVVDGTIYFLSDFGGSSDLYRLESPSAEPEKLTSSSDYYFRKAQTDGKSIVMQKGGDLFIYRIGDDEVEEIDVNYISSREVHKPKFVDKPEKFVDDVVVNPAETHVAVTARGKAFYFPFWEEGTRQLGKTDGSVRYKLPAFHPKDDLLYLVSDEMMEDTIEVYDLTKFGEPTDQIAVDLGIPYSMKVSPTGDHLAVFNNRMQVILVDLKEKSSKVIKEPDYGDIGSIDWSPDGKYLTYTRSTRTYGNNVVIYDLDNDEAHDVTRDDFADWNPRFSPDGKYLYFLSNRAFYPTMDPHIFQYYHPKTTEVFAIILEKGGKSPIKLEPKPLSEKGAKKDKKNGNGENGENGDTNGDGNGDSDDEKEEKLPEVTIDFAGIMDRVVKLPISNDRIHQLEVGKDRVWFRTSPVKGINPQLFAAEKPDNSLKAFLFKNHKVEDVMPGISSFSLSSGKQTLVVKQKDRIRLLPAEHLLKMEKGKENANNGNTRESRYLNLSRLKIKITPHKEWEQMMKESWKLMKDHYWEAGMGGVNWERMLERYLRLVLKISTRSELSDLLWELQAETGTSHSYEMGGDYDFPPNYAPAYLGGEVEFDAASGGYRITELLRGDVWDETYGSPLLRAGLSEGDIILGIDGQPLSQSVTVHELLMGKRGQEVYLRVHRQDEEEPTEISIKPVNNDFKLRYRDWVEQNRQYVHEKTEGKAGYFHIPNMHFDGLQEFYRYFKLETEYDSMIVDVRYNGGGHTSQIFLEKLARKRVGYNIPRYGKPSPYPNYTVLGPMVALTNQSAGSDGDIFSHSFKLMDLGTLIGTRTWGGVVGIWPKVRLVDKTTVTQPEYSFWFEDVGFDVENYGTDPDIEVDVTPNDAMAGADPQIDKGIEVILEQLEENPVEHPDFTDKPKKL